MKCPKCKSKRINVTTSTGNPVKECLECGVVWVCHGNKQVSYLYTDIESQGVVGI
jgi:uncharacterized Zn finger protein